jgi:hypothetical protein
MILYVNLRGNTEELNDSGLWRMEMTVGLITPINDGF